LLQGEGVDRLRLCSVHRLEHCPARDWDLDTRVQVRLGLGPLLRNCSCGHSHDHLEEVLMCRVRPLVDALKQDPPWPVPEGTDVDPFPLPLPREIRQRLWPQMRSIALARDGRHCCACKRDLGTLPSWYTEVHHIRARRDGGSDHPINLITLCMECHGRLTDELMEKMHQETPQPSPGPFF
jgi:5-methylcytosine-specific restriction protein A